MGDEDERLFSYLRTVILASTEAASESPSAGPLDEDDRATSASPFVTLATVLRVHQDQSRLQRIPPELAQQAYRTLLRLNLDPEPSWWKKLAKERVRRQRLR